MIKKITLIFLLISTVLLFGCMIKTDKRGVNSLSLSSIKSPTPEKTPEPLVESSMNDLEQEEFLKQYNRLSDNHIFKVSKKLSESGEMTKKEMLESINENISESDDTVSLKGLRFFQNLEFLSFSEADLVNIQELSFLNLDIISVYESTFKESLEVVFQVLNKIEYVDISNCNLKNIDFFKNIGEINATFNLENNNISDISGLKHLKYKDIDKLELGFNEIIDISVLKIFKNKRIGIRLNYNKISDISVFNEFSVPLERIELTGNRIMDVSPLQSLLNQNTFFLIGDNCILDYSSISTFMKEHYYNNNYHSEFEPKNGYFRIDSPPNFKLEINGNEVLNHQFVFFDTERYLGLEAVKTPMPACNALKFIEQIGGNADYDIDKGVLAVELEGKGYIFKDFEVEVDCDGKKKGMKKPMKRMQGNIPYISIEDMSKIFGLNISKKYGKTYKYAINDGDSMKLKHIKEMEISW